MTVAIKRPFSGDYYIKIDSTKINFSIFNKLFFSRTMIIINQRRACVSIMVLILKIQLTIVFSDKIFNDCKILETNSNSAS